jgi:hypothetical protein
MSHSDVIAAYPDNEHAIADGFPEADTNGLFWRSAFQAARPHPYNESVPMRLTIFLPTASRGTIRLPMRNGGSGMQRPWRVSANLRCRAVTPSTRRAIGCSGSTARPIRW